MVDTWEEDRKIFERVGETVYWRWAGEDPQCRKVLDPEEAEKYYDGDIIKIVTTTYRRMSDGKISVNTHTRRVMDNGRDYQDNWNSEVL